MFTTKSKKFGFFGTVFFHIGLLIIAFFSSIGYDLTAIEMVADRSNVSPATIYNNFEK